MKSVALSTLNIWKFSGKLAVKKGPVPSGPPGLPTGIVVGD